MKKFFYSLVLSGLLATSLLPGNADAATSVWETSTHAEGHGGVNLVSQGKVETGAGTLSYDGWASLTIEDAFSFGTITEAWVDGRGEHSQRNTFGYYSTVNANFGNPKRTAYNVDATGYRVVVSTNFKDKVPVNGWVESVRIYPKAYINFNNGLFKKEIHGYARAL